MSTQPNPSIQTGIRTNRRPGLPTAVSSYSAVGRRRDGQELFYMSLLGEVMSVDVKASSGIEAGTPKGLFQTGNKFPTMPQFAVTDNGHKFLVIEPAPTGDERMVVVTRWNSAPAP